MAEITVEEFNNLTGYQFFASSLEKMQNRLFAANVIEDTWDPGWWDARAYRCNKRGVVKLNSSNGDVTEFDIFDEEAVAAIPESHDCINPYNSSEYTQLELGYYEDDLYAYGLEVRNGEKHYILGGTGLNVNYKFVTAPLQLSDALEMYGIAPDNASMDVPAQTASKLKLKTVGSDSTRTVYFNDTDTSKRILNYADPYIAANFTGYQRDEVYRFGIVFYNRKHIPSPVYWIGDIKMPHSIQSPAFVNETSEQDGKNRLYGNALGIQFNVKNIPSDAMGYSIVRCDRTEMDRTVLMQCGVTNLLEYRISEQDKQVAGGVALDSSLEMRPLPFLSCFDHEMVLARPQTEGDDDRFVYVNAKVLTVPFYKRFISPEIVLSKNDMVSALDANCYTDYLYTLQSRIASDTAYSKIFASAKKVLLSNGSVKTITDLNSNYVRYEAGSIDNDNYEDVFVVRLQGKGDEYDYDDSNLEEITGVPYNGNIAKYYNIGNTSKLLEQHPQYNILDAKYSQDIAYNAFDSGVAAYKINIGERTYTNYAMSHFSKWDKGDPGQVTLGPAGPSIIVQLDSTNQLDDYFKTGFATKTEDNAKNINDLPVVNIKKKTIQYGGDTYSSRQNSIYISTNQFNNIDEQTSIVYGGDTYLNLLDYPSQFVY